MFVDAPPGACLWPAALIVWGPGECTSGHAHHCAQLVMALEGSLRVRHGPGEGWAQCAAALINADVRHQVDARNIPTLIAFVDVHSALSAALAARVERDITVIPAEDVQRWREQLGAPAIVSSAIVEGWIRRELLHTSSIPPMHPGVRRVLKYLREHVGDSSSFKLAELAEVAKLSSTRMMHAFTECVGVPLRPYVLWLRLQLASGELMKGTSVTDAAHAAGFADAAHMSRTFRRMLGTTPSELISRRQRTNAVFIKPE